MFVDSCVLFVVWFCFVRVYACVSVCRFNVCRLLACFGRCPSLLVVLLIVEWRVLFVMCCFEFVVGCCVEWCVLFFVGVCFFVYRWLLLCVVCYVLFRICCWLLC